ncbi:MAG TPA: hypothetical protein VJB59_03390 [Bdellovibrionota bacterium]|nr:hypothetical protein [Bdellovibrionota bacterium]
MGHFTIGLLAFLLSASASAGDIYDRLTQAQQAAIQKGQQVVMVEDVPGVAWPKVTVVQRVSSTPEEAAAVFADYELQPDYLDSMADVRIQKWTDRVTAVVDYTMSLFILTVRYTLQNRLSTYEKGKSYRVDWKMVRGESVKDIQGNVRFETLGTGTIMSYFSFINPNTNGFREKAISMTRDGAASIVRQIEFERIQDQDLLQRQIQRLRSALAAACR